MRVLHLNQHGHYAGGGEGYIAEVHHALLQAGHGSLLLHLASTGAESLVPESSRLQPQGNVGPRRRLYHELQNVLHDYQPDVAFVHTLHDPHVISYVAERLPTIAYVQSPYPVCPGSAYYHRKSEVSCDRPFGPQCLVKAQIERCCWGRNPVRHCTSLLQMGAFRRAYVNTHTILVGSGFMRDLLLANGYPPHKLEILPPLLLHAPHPELTTNPHSRVVLFAGRLVREKGLHKLLEALTTVSGDWSLLVAGEGEERDPCLALAKRLGLAERVRFAGWLGVAEMSAALGACAFVVIPSLWPEPFGRLGPEACLHGRPVVAFDVGGIRSWLDDGQTGYLVKPGDTAALGHAIEKLLCEPAHRETLGKQARAEALQRWGADDHATRLVSLFQEAMSAVRDPHSPTSLRDAAHLQSRGSP